MTTVMTTTATRRLQFCAGHRVHKHESKCRNLHGHNYVVFLTAASETEDPLDELGRVIDFGVLKEKFGAWIDEHWDHGFIVSKKDREAIYAVTNIEEQKVYFLDDNPTAENMAEHLLLSVGPEVLEGTGVKLVKVELWETENCVATAELGP